MKIKNTDFSFKGKFKPNIYVSLPGERTEIYLRQSGKCAICLKDLYEFGRTRDSAVLDHCHISNEVRGILCKKCNNILMKYKDNTEKLKEKEYTEYSKYLENHRSNSKFWSKLKKLKIEI